MAVLCLVATLEGGQAQGTLRLTGASPRIEFGQRAILKASCEGEAPEVTWIKPKRLMSFTPEGKLTAELRNVPLTCVGVPFGQPCVPHDPEYPALFWCRLTSTAGEAKVGPVAAVGHEVRTSAGELLDIAVHVICPWPTEAELNRIGSPGVPMDLDVSLTYGTGSASEIALLAGINNTIELIVPAPPPSMPPGPPPASPPLPAPPPVPSPLPPPVVEVTPTDSNVPSGCNAGTGRVFAETCSTSSHSHADSANTWCRILGGSSAKSYTAVSGSHALCYLTNDSPPDDDGVYWTWYHSYGCGPVGSPNHCNCVTNLVCDA